MKGKPRLIVLFIPILILAACAPVKEEALAPPPTALVPVEKKDVPAFSDDLNFKNLELAVGRSLQYYDVLPADRFLPFGKDRFTVGELRESPTNSSGS